MESQLGFSHFVQQADGIAIGILIILALFSIGSWYLIVSKGIRTIRAQRAADRFLQGFWACSDLRAAAELVRIQSAGEPLARMAEKGFAAFDRYKSGRSRGLFDTADSEAFVERALKQSFEEERLLQESGMTWLATVASSAPFIGLFGTVWGIYHALMAIGISGQGTLDKVAGPVGEALIMTAIGLGVAIPAAIAFNTFGRWNRRTLARLDSFAQDLLSVMSTGLGNALHRLPIDRIASMEGR